MKRILVTGANGFIGIQALRGLGSLGLEVHGVALENETIKDPPGGPDVVWHRANLLDGARTADTFATVRPELLLHLAWYTEHGLYWNSEKNRDWVRASLAMLEAFSRNGGRRAVLAGTCAEYDWGRTQEPCAEDRTPVAPRTLYGACKNELRLKASAFCEREGIALAWGRVFQPFGPYEPRQRLVPSVINSLLTGQEARCTAGTQLRDFMHSAEVASAFTALVGSGFKGPVNIASGRPVTIKDLVINIAEKLGRPELVMLGAIPTAKDDPPALTADVSRLNREVGWRPGGDLDSWLDDTIGWWRRNAVKA